MLLYLVKHLCPNLTNVTKKLSKANDNASPEAYKDLPHVIKNVLDMKNLGLKIEPIWNFNEPWEIVCFSDSDYEGDLVRRLHILCTRCTDLLAIKVTEKCDSFQLRCRVYSLIQGC